MKRYLLSALLTLTACDNSFVADNIDVVTCAWLPHWMADCTSPAVHDKALSVLQFGLIEAKVTCSGVANHASDGCGLTQNGSGTYVGHRLADGAAFVTLEQQTYLLGRAEPAAQQMSVAHPLFPLDTWSVTAGQLIVHKDGCTDIAFDLQSQCSGFNLEAFAN